MELITDNGPQFFCFEFARWAMTYDIKHTTSSPRYPQGNGLVERFVQTIKTLLKKAAHSGDDFSMALLAYRSTPQETTGVAPAQLLMGRQLRTSLPSNSALLQPKLISRKVVKKRDQV